MKIQTLYAELLKWLSGLEAGRPRGIARPTGFFGPLEGRGEMKSTDGFESSTR